MNTENQPEIHLKSEELQDIITYKPHWLVRWGMSFILFFLLLTLTASWLIHYPEFVKAPFRLTSVNAPKAVFSKTNSKVIRLLVKDHEYVKSGQPLAFLESTADHKQVLLLSNLLKTMIDDRRDVSWFQDSTFSHLGELQMDYQSFFQAYRQYLSLGENGYYSHQKALLEKELADMIGLEKTLMNQLRIQQQDLEIAQEEYNIQQVMAEQKVIAPLELKREKSKLLAKQLPLQETKASLFANRFAQSSKQKEILELDRIKKEGQSIFVQALNTLQSAIEDWKKRFIIVAPLNGIVTYSLLLEEKQTVSADQELFYVTPESGNYFGEVFVPQQNLGKVKPGQKVLIKFESYPYQEFGQVEGRIDYLSDISTKQTTFLAKVNLPNGLITQYQKKITYKTGMVATAEIITGERRLVESLFYNIKKVIDDNSVNSIKLQFCPNSPVKDSWGDFLTSQAVNLTL